MRLYTRKQYEEDCQQIDAKIAQSASLLGMQLIGPLDHWTRAKKLDELKRKLGTKLAMTAVSLADKSKMERGKRFAWVIGARKRHENGCPQLKNKTVYCNCHGEWFVTRKKEPLIKHGQPHYRDTSLNEIEELERQGVTVMESGFMKKKAKEDGPEEPEFMPLEWVEVTEAESKKYQAAGHEYEKDGKKYWASHYMVRYEGEDENRKWFVTDVR